MISINTYMRSITPIPNSAKSYFTGSSASISFRLAVSSSTVLKLVCLWVMRPSLRATRSTCTSSGHSNWLGFISCHKPKSTPLGSLRAIQRRYMHNRLHDEPRTGVGMCFLVRCGASSKLKKSLWKPANALPICSSVGARCLLKAVWRLLCCW